MCKEQSYLVSITNVQFIFKNKFINLNLFNCCFAGFTFCCTCAKGKPIDKVEHVDLLMLRVRAERGSSSQPSYQVRVLISVLVSWEKPCNMGENLPWVRASVNKEEKYVNFILFYMLLKISVVLLNN